MLPPVGFQLPNSLQFGAPTRYFRNIIPLMIVRAEQMAEFEKASVHNWENRMVDYIRQFSPRHGRLVEHEHLREAVQLAMQNAGEYGITAQTHLRRYIELMVLLGSRFDRDEQYSWASTVLTDEGIDDPDVKMARLDYEAVQYIEMALGSSGQIRDAALRRARASLNNLRGPAGGADIEIARWLHFAYPEKLQHLGRTGVLGLIGAARALAARLEIGPGAAGVLAGLAALFGSGFTDDPLVRWPAPALKATVGREQDRVDALIAAAERYIGYWLG